MAILCDRCDKNCTNDMNKFLFRDRTTLCSKCHKILNDYVDKFFEDMKGGKK